MVFIDFKTIKISGEKKGKITNSIDVRHNVILNDVSHLSTNKNMEIGGNFVKIDSTFTAEYMGLGKIEVSLRGIYKTTKEICEEIVKTFEKDKKLPSTLVENINTTIYQRSILKTIILSNELDLPTPIPLPTIKKEKKSDKKQKK